MAVQRGKSPFMMLKMPLSSLSRSGVFVWCFGSDAGWSSPVARQAHNLKVAGSNPAPATTIMEQPPGLNARGLFSFAAR